MSRRKPIDLGVVESAGIVTRFVRGKKFETDVRMDIRTRNAAWYTLAFRDLAMQFEALADNEDRRYGPPAKGGEYLLEALAIAREYGYDSSEFDEKMRER